MGLKEKLSELIGLLAMVICVAFLVGAIINLYAGAFLQALAGAVLFFIMLLAWGFNPWKRRPHRNDPSVCSDRPGWQNTRKEETAGKSSSVWFPFVLCLLFLFLGLLKRAPLLLGTGLVFGSVFYLRRRAKQRGPRQGQ